ncbi:MAG: hypothetical protein V3T83_11495 [Acidobacteriota bacterium]
MITVLMSLVFIAMVLALYIYNLARLTHPDNAALRESLKDSCAIALLREMEGSTRAKTYMGVFGKMRQEYERTFVQRMMPLLLGEARKVTLAARSPLAVFYFGVRSDRQLSIELCKSPVFRKHEIP